MEHSTPDSLILECEIWAELFTHRTMIQEIAVASSLVNVWQLLIKQEKNNPNKKLHTRQKLIKSKPEGPAS